MVGGSRVTDAVDFFKRRGELRDAVRAVRGRAPERLRWRAAVGSLTETAGHLGGITRARVEEPIREAITEVPDKKLRTEVVLDARRFGVDLDRGELLPVSTVSDVRRIAYLTGTELERVQRYVQISDDFFAPIDTAAVVLVARAWADFHRRRARKLWLELPDQDGKVAFRLHHQIMAERAKREARHSERWRAFSNALIDVGTSAP